MRFLRSALNRALPSADSQISRYNFECFAVSRFVVSILYTGSTHWATFQSMYFAQLGSKKLAKWWRKTVWSNQVCWEISIAASYLSKLHSPCLIVTICSKETLKNLKDSQKILRCKRVLKSFFSNRLRKKTSILSFELSI